jgi:hypothetical protein
VASLDGSYQRDFVDILDFETHRNAEGDPADPDSHGLDQAGQVERGGLTVRRRRSGQDDLLDLRIAETFEKFPDPELVGIDSLEGGKPPFEDMVKTFEFARFFKRV